MDVYKKTHHFHWLINIMAFITIIIINISLNKTTTTKRVQEIIIIKTRVVIRYLYIKNKTKKRDIMMECYEEKKTNILKYRKKTGRMN